MVRTTTTMGSTERGSAIQRHFTREIDNEVDGVRAICSFSAGSVTVNAGDNVQAVLDAAAKWGGEAALFGGEERAWQYSTGGVALEVSFD